jgi:hypothetical protein
MLRFTAEIVPFGMESVKRPIGTIEVANIGGTTEVGNYKYVIQTEGEDEVTGVLKGFNRDRGAIELLREILNKESLEDI